MLVPFAFVTLFALLLELLDSGDKAYLPRNSEEGPKHLGPSSGGDY